MKLKLTVVYIVSLVAVLLLITASKLEKQIKIAPDGIHTYINHNENQNFNLKGNINFPSFNSNLTNRILQQTRNIFRSYKKEYLNTIINNLKINIIGQITDNSFKALWEDNLREMKSLNPQLYIYRFSTDKEIKNFSTAIKKSYPATNPFHTQTLTSLRQLKTNITDDIIRDNRYSISSTLLNEDTKFNFLIYNNLYREKVFNQNT